MNVLASYLAQSPEGALADEVVQISRAAQRFLSVHDGIHNHFQLRRHHLFTGEHRAFLYAAFRAWREATCAVVAA
jgi:hypothetical protein